MPAVVVNAQHTKNLPGRKSDVQESQWLLKLHTRIAEQLLPATVQDSDFTHLLEAAATTRHRSGHLCATHAESVDANEYSARQCDQRSERGDRADDVRAIVAGQRDPRKLAELSHPRIQASRTEIAKSLEGTSRPYWVIVSQVFSFLWKITANHRWFRGNAHVRRSGGWRLQPEIRCDLLRNGLSRPNAHTVSSPLPGAPP